MPARKKYFTEEERKAADRAKAAKWHAKNKEKVDAYRATEPYLEAQRRYKTSDKGRATAARISREARALNPERQKNAFQKWKASHRAEFRALRRKYTAELPGWVLAKKLGLKVGGCPSSLLEAYRSLTILNRFIKKEENRNHD